jgi:hypothetical protein
MKLKHNLQNYVTLVHIYSFIKLLFEVGCYQCPTTCLSSSPASGSIAAGVQVTRMVNIELMFRSKNEMNIVLKFD